MKQRQKLRKGIILTSFFLFPAIFYYLSPVLIIQASMTGIISGSFIMFLIMFISALFMGRGYCGWVCPAAGCQEAIFTARDKKVTKGDFVKWVIWVPWIGAIIILAVRAGGYHDIDFFYQTTYGFSVADLPSLIAYFMVLFLLIVAPAFIFGKRSFCHHLCWMAPFMILGRKVRNLFKWSSLTLTSTPEACIHCRTCTNSCPMSLPVEAMVTNNKLENSECILCGTCVDGCKQGVLTYRWGK
jgi:ferredoxin-type protein NapH